LVRKKGGEKASQRTGGTVRRLLMAGVKPKVLMIELKKEH
jgi:hypothetical protein